MKTYKFHRTCPDVRLAILRYGEGSQMHALAVRGAGDTPDETLKLAVLRKEAHEAYLRGRVADTEVKAKEFPFERLAYEMVDNVFPTRRPLVVNSLTDFIGSAMVLGIVVLVLQIGQVL